MTRLQQDVNDVAKRLEHAAEDIHNYSPDFSQAAADFLHGDAAWLVERVRTLETELKAALDELAASEEDWF